MEALDKILQILIESNQTDLYIFAAEVNESTADRFIIELRKNEFKKPKCSLILTTYGGVPDAGYRIMRALKRCYKSISLYVFGSCKSTGTLMALAADEIVMSDFGEFGPLDIQLAKDDELSNTSGLNLLQSLMSLNEQMFRCFEDNFLSLKRKSGYTITTRTAAEISSKLAIGLISPISAQIDPVKLGEVQRSIKIANDYGSRLCRNNELIAKLIVGYPSHGFVIDFVEAKEIFSNVRWVNEIEIELEKTLFKLVRKEGNENFIMQLIPDKPEEVVSVDPIEDKVSVNELEVKDSLISESSEVETVDTIQEDSTPVIAETVIGDSTGTEIEPTILQ